jgi:hypothetical protein
MVRKQKNYSSLFINNIDRCKKIPRKTCWLQMFVKFLQEIEKEP